MTNKNFSPNYTSADLEKAALGRFRSLISFLPRECKLSRELWNRSTVVCMDFEDCSHLLETAREQSFLLLLVANYLGLANSVLFRMGNKAMGWMTMVSTTSA
ncbi:MAG: hypothetical protein F6K36_28875 [Symploca sp. SIO3C6]|uniref:Uncharacterized protein n=1 Tax=Symploca sp. SIO1C4 TaxID=2607765 RepID=A0A6B3NB64_9CYAN|nr:hypothetical protein [Symploca sp. SIO3C6]NER28917.1 hypothetical protein [Symploca sp. SIO1C4]NET08178.1 hypothetical protein [Symploca sp. SIO2B6]